jgi:hypothetical protein
MMRCENRILRRIFGSKRDEVTGSWRTLHNEIHNSPDRSIIRDIKSEVEMCWISGTHSGDENSITNFSRRA